MEFYREDFFLDFAILGDCGLKKVKGCKDKVFPNVVMLLDIPKVDGRDV